MAHSYSFLKFSIFSVYHCCCLNLSQHKLMPSLLNLIETPISINGTNKYWNIYSYDNNCCVCLRVAISLKYIKYCSNLLKRLLSYLCLCGFTGTFSVLWKNPSKIRNAVDIVNLCIQFFVAIKVHFFWSILFSRSHSKGEFPRVILINAVISLFAYL